MASILASHTPLHALFLPSSATWKKRGWNHHCCCCCYCYYGANINGQLSHVIQDSKSSWCRTLTVIRPKVSLSTREGFQLNTFLCSGCFSWGRDTPSGPVHMSMVPLWLGGRGGAGCCSAPQAGFPRVVPSLHVPVAARNATGMRLTERRADSQQPLRPLWRTAMSGLQWLMWC